MSQSPPPEASVPRNPLRAEALGLIVGLGLAALAAMGIANWRVPPVALAVPEIILGDIAAKADSLIVSANAGAYTDTLAWTNAEIDRAFEVVEEAIAPFADRHYSMTGQWVELAAAFSTKRARALLAPLTDPVDSSIRLMAHRLPEHFSEAFRTRLEALAQAEGLDLAVDLSGELSQTVAADRSARLRVSVPVGSALGVAAGTMLARSVTQQVGRSLAARLTSGLAVRFGLGQTGAFGTGASIGAAACGFTGLGAVPCGVAGGILTYLAADKISVELAEWWGRDAFEADLRASLPRTRNALKADLAAQTHAMMAELDRRRPCMVSMTTAEWDAGATPACPVTTDAPANGLAAAAGQAAAPVQGTASASR
ncbi:hypothetical protein [Paracoccus sanguinis]|uniref:Uncharacterized protein n=1 Tax=Paracoccus sanguinis TaxID=1545044 RepID=A0A1H2T766_9RHOB|nr:hypothetical protein [Paracoccus sanguinis]KGJ16641.1 hypothetical protein IX57_11410 [Paracoccus sanguinis]SDW39084.1 hypothetical protein SAMN05444276_101849 [Paracoccus sanguinis]